MEKRINSDADGNPSKEEQTANSGCDLISGSEFRENNLSVFSNPIPDSSLPAPAGPVSDLHTPVHLRDDNSAATLVAVPPDGQAFPVNEGDAMPVNTSNDANIKIGKIKEVITFLAVSDPAHLRYKPFGGNTFCNIYAYDLSFLMGRDLNQYFIPRVWWNNAAVTNITNGIPQLPSISATLKEMTANDLYDWFDKFGGNFGWLKQNDLTALQEAVNSTGDIGVIVGKKPGSHGHITIIVPEQAATPAGVFQAIRDAAGKVINPLQSQAGARNFEFGNSTIGGLPWFTTGGHISAFYVFNQL
jgi:hypothetical protein